MFVIKPLEGEDQSPIFKMSPRGKLFFAAAEVDTARVECALKIEESTPASCMTSHNHLAMVHLDTEVVGMTRKVSHGQVMCENRWLGSGKH